MNTVEWRRVILCGLVAGTAWTLLSAVLVGALGGDFFAAISDKVGGGAVSPAAHPSLYGLSVGAGMWAMWLYAVIRPHSGSNIKAGIAVGLAWWVIVSLQSLKWIVLLDIPTAVWLPLGSNAVASVAATIVGALLYGNVQPKVPVGPTTGSSQCSPSIAARRQP